MSVHLDDDLRAIAGILDGHPRIEYKEDDLVNPEVSAQAMVDKMWHHMSGSSVWLPDFNVFILFTRIPFGENIYWPTISFLRGRIFDEDWNQLDDYKLHWGNRTYTFPLVFDVDIPHTPDGSCFGPEDPRVILEEGIEGAEPVVLFNMAGPVTEWKRSMYLYRPFSNVLTLLTIGLLARPDMEKNWQPFFVPQYSDADSNVRIPNEYIHFIYKNKPLRILRCHLQYGACEFIFEQTVPQDLFYSRREDMGDLRGGSNFIDVPLELPQQIRQRVDAWAAFPRTHINTDCGPALYRPELFIMIRVDGLFYLSFASESLDFGNAILEYGPDDDRCAKGKILIPMSISRWDTHAHVLDMATYSPDRGSVITYRTSEKNKTDVMTATFSVDDTSVQVARISGLLALVLSIPQVKALDKMEPSTEDGESAELKNIFSSWVADDVRGCLVEAAINYTQPWLHSADGSEGKPPEHKKLLTKEHGEQEIARLTGETPPLVEKPSSVLEAADEAEGVFEYEKDPLVPETDLDGGPAVPELQGDSGEPIDSTKMLVEPQTELRRLVAADSET